MRKIYISYSLDQASDIFNDTISSLKNILSKEYEVLYCSSLDSIDPQEFYKNDLRRVLTSDIFLAVCDNQNINLGYKMAVALEKYSKPTLAVALDSTKIDLILESIEHPMYTFRYYKNIDNILTLIKEKELKHFKQAVPVEVCGTDVCMV